MGYMIPIGDGVETAQQRRDELFRLRDQGQYGLRIDEPIPFRERELNGTFTGLKVYGRSGIEAVLEAEGWTRTTYCKAVLLIIGDDGSEERINFSYWLVQQ